jgi:hypothetical protein
LCPLKENQKALISVKNIINDLYVDKKQHVFDLILKYELEQPIQNLVNFINNKIQKKQSGIKGLPSAFLTQINSGFLAKIQDSEEKRELEEILSNISTYLLEKYIQSINLPSASIVKDLQEELKTTCEINSFDYNALNKVFPIETLVKFAKLSSNTSEEVNLLTKPPIYYYEWNGGSPNNLDDLIKNLKSENHISNVWEFRRIFKEHTGDIRVLINKESLDFIIILFDTLVDKNKQLLIPRGKNCGKFHPLKLYAVDFDKKVLIENEPKHIKYRIMKNESYYLKLKGKAEKWIKDYKVKKLTSC